MILSNTSNKVLECRLIALFIIYFKYLTEDKFDSQHIIQQCLTF